MKKGKRILRIIFFIIAVSALLLSGLVYTIDQAIINSSKDKIYTNIEKIPYNKAGLLLGTSRKLKNGQPNQFFSFRIEAAVKLFEAGKIDFIIVSGDNRHNSYNEPRDMRNELIKRGIPSNRIYADYAGFRTLDSVVRCFHIFGQKSFTVISQNFHNQRAVFIARNKDLDAIGFNAQDVDSYNSFKTLVREKFARVKAFIDIYIINKQPHFLGSPVELEK